MLLLLQILPYNLLNYQESNICSKKVLNFLSNNFFWWWVTIIVMLFRNIFWINHKKIIISIFVIHFLDITHITCSPPLFTHIYTSDLIKQCKLIHNWYLCGKFVFVNWTTTFLLSCVDQLYKIFDVIWFVYV